MIRMTASHSHEAAVAYFDQGLSKGDGRGDYYGKGQATPGVWFGKDAERLGLEAGSEVNRDQFAHLARASEPGSGKQLTQRIREDRKAGYDITFLAPKSISIAGLVGGDERVIEAHDRAVTKVMGRIEDDMITRDQRAGKARKVATGGLAAGLFRHVDSRPGEDGKPDPMLHTHAYVFNVTYSEERGGWYSPEFHDIKKDMPYYQALYHKEMAAELQARGFEVVATKDAFEIKGLEDRDLVEKFSRRTEAIERYAREKGITDTEEKARAGLRTRQRKSEPMALDSLQDYWDGRLTDRERRQLREVIANASGDKPPSSPPGPSTGQAIDYARDHLFQRHSTVPERRLVAEALAFGVASPGVTPEAVERQVRERTDLLRGTFRDERYLSTREVYAEEQRMLDFASGGINARRPFKDGTLDFAPIIDKKTGKAHSLSGEQKQAVRDIVHGTDRVQLFLGRAGTGKTTTLNEIRRHIEESGYEFLSYAPSTNARNLLRNDTFANAETTQKLLADPKLQDKVHSRSVLAVDEAGLVSSRDMAHLFQIAEDKGARVLLVGDYHQHFSVERGDGLRLVAQNSGIKPAKLEKITRQRPRDYRKAVELVSQGRVAEGIHQLDTQQAIKEVETGERHLHLAAAYLEARDEGKTALVISPSHREKDAVTEIIRDELKGRGDISGEEHTIRSWKSRNWTEAQRGNAGLYRPGDVVEFNQNARGGFVRGSRWKVTGTDKGLVRIEDQHGRRDVLPLQQARRFEVYEAREIGIAKGDVIRLTKNGTTSVKQRRIDVANNDLFTVAGFTADGDLITTKGWVLSKHYSHLENGIVRTSHSSQGTTVDRVLIAQGTESFGASSREQFYVSISRGKEKAVIFTDDREGLMKSVERSGQRLSATELIDQRAREAAEARESRMRWMARRARIAMNEAADAAKEKARETARQVRDTTRSWTERIGQERRNRPRGYVPGR